MSAEDEAVGGGVGEGLWAPSPQCCEGAWTHSGQCWSPSGPLGLSRTLA